jgi:hypothetical protein
MELRLVLIYEESRDSSVGIALGYGLDVRGGGEWSVSLPGRFTPRGRTPGTRRGGWVGSRAILDAVVKRKIPRHSRDSNYLPIIQPVAERSITELSWSCYKVCRIAKFTYHDVHMVRFNTVELIIFQ